MASSQGAAADSFDIECRDACGLVGTEWDVDCGVHAHALSFRLEGDEALAEADECLVFSFTQCAAADAAAHGVPVDPVDAIVYLRAVPPVLDAVVYSRAAGRTEAAPARCFHVLVQYARADERRLDFGGTGPVAARATGSVPYTDLLGATPAVLVVRTTRGNTLRLVPLCAAVPIAPRFTDEASMRSTLREGVTTAIEAHEVRAGDADASAPRVRFASARVCMGYGHDSATVAPDAPVAHPCRPVGAAFPRDRTHAPARAADLARLLRGLIPGATARADAAPLAVWLDVIAESFTAGVAHGRDADTVGTVSTRTAAAAAAAVSRDELCRVPWTAVANASGGECVRTHTSAAHIRHVRTLWQTHAVSERFTLCDAVERGGPDGRTHPVLIAFPRAHATAAGATTDAPPSEALLFSPGAWRWPTLWAGAAPAWAAAAVQMQRNGGAEPLGFWTPDVVARLSVVALATPPRAGAQRTPTDDEFRTALMGALAAARRRDAFVVATATTGPRAPSSIHTHTVCTLGPCVYTLVATSKT